MKINPTTSWNGGSCLQLTTTINPGKCQTYKLYKMEIESIQELVAIFTLKNKTQNEDIRFFVVDVTGQTIMLDSKKSANINGWTGMRHQLQS